MTSHGGGVVSGGITLLTMGLEIGRALKIPTLIYR